VTSARQDAYRATDAIAGLLAAFALFLGGMQLFYRPFRMFPVAVILLLIATVMSRRQQKLTTVTAAVVAICFVAGAALQVWTKHPLY
jgi:hypothetical protein